jgi:hypothetical protein
MALTDHRQNCTPGVCGRVMINLQEVGLDYIHIGSATQLWGLVFSEVIAAIG